MTAPPRPAVSEVLRFGAAWGLTLAAGAWALALVPLVGGPAAWERVAPRWGRAVLRLTGVEVDVEGKEHLGQPAVYVVNHVSLIDVVYLPAILPPRARWVVKQELINIPLWGWAIKATGAICIDRSHSEDAVARIQHGIRNLPPDTSVVVFPEGTRSRSKQMLPFKKGAFHIAMATGLPMVPLGSAGPERIVPAGGFVVRRGRITVNVGAPISTRAWTRQTLADHIAETRSKVEALIAQADARHPRGP